MKDDLLFDFSKGKTAEYLKDKYGIELKYKGLFEIKEFIGIKFGSKIYSKGDSYFFQDGNDEYLMFKYKRHSYIHRNGLPRYHIIDCETVKNNTGFYFASNLPVDVICTETRNSYPQSHLELCGNCSNEVFNNMFGNKANWSQAVLDYAAKDKNQIILSDGYTTMWKQISKAYREKKRTGAVKNVTSIYLKEIVGIIYMFTIGMEINLIIKKTTLRLFVFYAMLLNMRIKWKEEKGLLI